ncbi:unnamed protein product [Oikopleura dioica]|uniref:Uncharacterized protein n=1 Tax=Oikopleura dioica TaxID=34765 RepID=E4X419_OIKDI|nr:unnamed protein product [Oikopleura dioica]
MSRPASPYLQQSKASPRPSSSKSRASKAATIKAFRSTTPSLDAMRNVKKSQQFSSTKTKPTRIRPGALPDPETLYDELEASRKEISAQKQLINAQKTRNQRLEQDLKSREVELERIYSGDNGKESTTKNDQLRCKLIRLERDLRQKDVDLGKLQFEMKTTDVNELKIALKIYVEELERLRSINQDRSEESKASVQRERKAQIAGLKKAIQASGKECETLRIENEKYKNQLDTLRKTDLDSKLKMKNENEYLKTQLRKTRKENPSAVLAGTASKPSEDELIKLKSENEFLRQKVDKMSEELESLHQQLENSSKRESADHQNQQSEIASLKRQLEKSESILVEEKASRNDLRQHSEKLESEIELLERKLEAAVGPRPPSQNAQAQSSARARRRGSNASVTSSVKAAPVKPPRAVNASNSAENDELILGGSSKPRGIELI